MPSRSVVKRGPITLSFPRDPGATPREFDNWYRARLVAEEIHQTRGRCYLIFDRRNGDSEGCEHLHRKGWLK